MMIWVTKLGAAGYVACGRCHANATCVVHNSDSVAASSIVRFFCGHDLRSHLESQPELLNLVLERMDLQELHSLYQSAC